MRLLRVLILAAGLVIGAVGAVHLVEGGLTNLVAASTWLLGGVVVHDAIIAPLVIALGALVATLLPRWARAPAASAAVVLGTMTLVAVPVLGRFGARSDNPTLLDRPYGTGWLVFAGLVLAVAAVGAAVRRHREKD
ncbi:hypothetical protein [Sanguibacter antarcticus]|uniref:Uncharacterized protein n=1 Tax=Sanguibacter antarcticus TaxID=372484 RepID=A0A2A9E7Y7_9MICO|nr:hypothetical protein [Sanguibacter antarcticus]PFG34280.1 hypothetical protein ATL42_2186 [Sanguibacter antarcticus]